MKKILFAIGYSAQIGGGQKVFIATIKELSKMDCQITVMLPDNTLVSFLKLLNVNIHVVDFRSPKSLVAIHKILKENDFDVINTYLPKVSLLVSLVNLFYRKPICCTLLNAILHEKLNRFQKSIYPFLYFILSRMCDGFIVNSKQNKKHFIDVARINSNSIKVIYSGIDVNEFHGFQNEKPRNPKFVLGAIGRLSPEKGHIYLLRALADISNIDYKCLIVGDGPSRDELESYARKANLDKRVEFLGFQANVACAMSQMDAVIMPSLNETFGITIVEAFAMKKVVIASDAGGIPELVINEKTGLLFPAKDCAVLARKILYVYNNKEEAQAMAIRGYEYFKNNFTSAAMAENTIKYYDSLIKIRSH